MDDSNPAQAVTSDRPFLSAFERNWRRNLAELGDRISVVIRLGDELHHSHGGEQTTITLVDEQYHQLKRIAHLPILVFLARTCPAEDDACPVEKHGIDDAIEVDETLQDAGRRICRLSNDFWSATEQELTWSILNRFVHDVYAPVQLLVRAAAELEVDRLHAAIGRLETQTANDAWRSGYFCVVGGKEPRYKELTTQYFRTYLQRNGSARGGVEHQLIYAEGEHQIDSVLELIARRHLNRTLGELFTGSATGLEEDVLGDAAALAIARCFE